jgi:hypothetical protein
MLDQPIFAANAIFPAQRIYKLVSSVTRKLVLIVTLACKRSSPRRILGWILRAKPLPKKAPNKRISCQFGQSNLCFSLIKICKNFAICEKQKCVGLGKNGVTKLA